LFQKEVECLSNKIRMRIFSRNETASLKTHNNLSTQHNLHNLHLKVSNSGLLCEKMYDLDHARFPDQ